MGPWDKEIVQKEVNKLAHWYNAKPFKEWGTINIEPVPYQYANKPIQHHKIPDTTQSPIMNHKIPQQLLIDAEKELIHSRLAFFKEHYNPIHQTMPEDKIREFRKNYVEAGCSWAARLDKEFPFLVKKKDWKDEVKREGFIPAMRSSDGSNVAESTNAHDTVPNFMTLTEKQAVIIAEKIKLLVEMHKFAELRNAGWVPSWNGSDYAYCIEAKAGENRCKIEYWQGSNRGVFGVTFKTKEIAQEALEIFGERIKQFYSQQF